MYSFAVLPYANAAPLVHFIPQVHPGAKLIVRRPRDTVFALLSGEVDAAIIPVADYFNTPGLEMVKGVGICADGQVESVLLQCRRQLREVRTIRLDPASKTSNLLLKILVKNHFPIYHDISFGQDIAQADADVMIGDRALCAGPAFASYDLAGQWQSLTDLPFVFAVWVYRVGHPDSRKLTYILHAAKRMGCHHISELSTLSAERLGIDEARCQHYLTSCLYYDVGLREEMGMQLFQDLSVSLVSKTKQHA